jgi:hypothetical protein
VNGQGSGVIFLENEGSSAYAQRIESGNSSSVYRCTARDSRHVLSIVAKFTTAREAAIHQLIQGDVPGVSPFVFGTVPTRSDKVLVSMEDLEPSSYAAASVGPKELRAGLQKLINVHERFFGGANVLPKIGTKILSNELPIDAKIIADLLDSCSSLFGLQLRSGVTGVIRRAAKHSSEWLFHPKIEQQTLVHGDFHQGNLLRNESGSVYIVDWGSAGWHLPQWDLFLLSDADLLFYLGEVSERAAFEPVLDSFWRDLRRVKIGRLFKLLAVCLVSIFTNSGTFKNQRFINMIPFYSTELVHAIESSPEGSLGR